MLYQMNALIVLFAFDIGFLLDLHVYIYVEIIVYLGSLIFY